MKKQTIPKLCECCGNPILGRLPSAKYHKQCADHIYYRMVRIGQRHYEQKKKLIAQIKELQGGTA